MAYRMKERGSSPLRQSCSAAHSTSEPRRSPDEKMLFPPDREPAADAGHGLRRHGRGRTARQRQKPHLSQQFVPLVHLPQLYRRLYLRAGGTRRRFPGLQDLRGLGGERQHIVPPPSRPEAGGRQGPRAGARDRADTSIPAIGLFFSKSGCTLARAPALSLPSEDIFLARLLVRVATAHRTKNEGTTCRDTPSRTLPIGAFIGPG